MLELAVHLVRQVCLEQLDLRDKLGHKARVEQLETLALQVQVLLVLLDNLDQLERQESQVLKEPLVQLVNKEIKELKD